MDSGRKILIVDDDKALTDMLAELLQTEGLVCMIANNGKDALRIEKENSPDLVILDVMMPGDDGISTLRALRETSDVAVLMLTAMGDEDDRILGLEAGADDYLAKPFVARELVLRIQAILRRVAAKSLATPGTAVTAGPVTVEPGKQRARLDGKTLPLTGAELAILEALASAPGEVVSREHLTEFALGRKLTPYDRALDTHVSHLRRKLDDASASVAVRIGSVRGSGYRLVIE